MLEVYFQSMTEIKLHAPSAVIGYVWVICVFFFTANNMHAPHTDSNKNKKLFEAPQDLNKNCQKLLFLQYIQKLCLLLDLPYY